MDRQVGFRIVSSPLRKQMRTHLWTTLLGRGTRVEVAYLGAIPVICADCYSNPTWRVKLVWTSDRLELGSIERLRFDSAALRRWSETPLIPNEEFGHMYEPKPDHLLEDESIWDGRSFEMRWT